MEQDITLNDRNLQLPCFFAAPKDASRAIILIHEIWGLDGHIKDVARRLASEGYAVLAPDLLGDTGVLGVIEPSVMHEMSDPAKRSEAQKRFRDALAPMQAPGFAERMMQKLRLCGEHLKGYPFVAVIGFCFGGTYAFAMAAEPGIKAAIPFYGQPPSAELVAKIHCPVLAFYGEQDENLMKSLPELEDAMKMHSKRFSHKVYKNAGHAFFNDTSRLRYHKEAADDSWKLALDFLDKLSSE